MKFKITAVMFCLFVLLFLGTSQVLGSASNILPVNESIHNSKTVWFNCTGDAGSTYNATIGYDNGTSYGTVTYVNDTLSHFHNSTTLERDSAYGKWHNFTLYEDAVSQGIYFFKVDSTAPTIHATPSYTLGNYTSGGNVLNVTFNITDENPSSCYLELHYDDGTITNITGDSDDVTYSAANSAYCYFNLTPDDIEQDGYVEVKPSAKDAAGNENSAVYNQSYIIYRLKTGWNLVTGYENKTLSEIADEFEKVTYVSAFNNDGGYKNFTTYTVGGSTNENVTANFSSNYSSGAAYIYVSEDIVSMRRYYTPLTSWTNASLYVNDSASKTPWNIIGITEYLTDMNETLYQDVCLNLTGSNVGANCSNITWASWYDIQNGEYCSWYRGRKATSCDVDSTDLNLTRGDALWLAVEDDLILQRSLWS